jgi:hypothetical protein
MQLMNQNLWEIVKGIEKSPRDRNKLLEWKNRDNKTKSIVGLALSDLELYHTDLEKSSKVILLKIHRMLTVVMILGILCLAT